MRQISTSGATGHLPEQALWVVFVHHVNAVPYPLAVPAGVSQCETLGPLAPPSFSLSNTQPNVVTVTITPEAGAAAYVISRATSPDGPFDNIATVTTTYNDDNGGQGLSAGQTFYYQVRASRAADLSCVSGADTRSITVTVGQVITPAPILPRRRSGARPTGMQPADRQPVAGRLAQPERRRRL